MLQRPGKYIEYNFPLHEVNRLAVKEANSKKPIYTMHKWWARRLSCVFRTILLASAIDWDDWDHLEPWQTDDDGDFVSEDGGKITDEWDFHRRVRRQGVNSAWERLYYRLDDEANAVIQWSFTKPKGEPKDKERLRDYLEKIGASLDDEQWWEDIDWDAREPITVLDPFMGGGTTIVESLRLGANAVGVDLNPVAWFVTKKETDGCDLDALQEAFEQVKADVAEEIKSYYKTQCPACGKQADVMYVFWVKKAPCLERTCDAVVPLYNSFVIAKKPVAKTLDRDVPRNRDGETGMLLEDGDWKSIQFIKCPDCGTVYGSKRRPGEKETTCPNCSNTFDPTEGWAGNGKYTCQECGAENEILEAAKQNVPDGMDRNVPLDHDMYALEIYCPHCEYKTYKEPDEADRALFQKAKAEFEANEETLEYPTQKIPNEGAKTKVDCDMEGHGYHYWYELFNERQLLCLCRLRDAIMKVEDQNLREYLLMSWSYAIGGNNMFCRYHSGRSCISQIYDVHAIIPRLTPTENCIWGAQFGMNTFENMVQLIPDSIDWADNPDDNFFHNDDEYDKRTIGDGIYRGSGTATLAAQSSEDLTGVIPSLSQLAVTDPPYYGNVMYAELSDLYYVWLRTALRGSYSDEFSAPLTPKEEEVVETVTRGHGAEFLYKDEEFFTNGLTPILFT